MPYYINKVEISDKKAISILEKHYNLILENEGLFEDFIKEYIDTKLLDLQKGFEHLPKESPLHDQPEELQVFWICTQLDPIELVEYYKTLTNGFDPITFFKSFYPYEFQIRMSEYLNNLVEEDEYLLNRGDSICVGNRLYLSYKP